MVVKKTNKNCVDTNLNIVYHLSKGVVKLPKYVLRKVKKVH